jgi:zinc protease
MENGLKVMLEENRNAPVVSLQIWVKVGSADEKDEEAGMCHFIEHMIFKGTEKRKVREMAREIESLGGYINAYTSYDQTVFYITIASRYAQIALDILADAIQNSIFDPEELEKEREVILEEIRMGEDDPSRRIFRQTMAALFENHPYRRPIIGFDKTIKSITREQMISFFKKWYVPNRMVFIAVGDFNIKEMEKKIRETFKEFRSSSFVLSKRLNEPEPKNFKEVFSFGQFKETYLQIAFPITHATHEDTPALDALSHILGGGESSRLVQKVKLEKGLVHSISSSSFTPKDPGAFFIDATLLAENVDKAIEAILDEIIKIQKEGVSSDELYRVKVNIESERIYDRQTVQGQARKMGYYEIIAGDINFEKEYIRKIGLLESDDIKKVVEKYLKSSHMVISILFPNDKNKFFKDRSFKNIISKYHFDREKEKTSEEQKILKTVLENGIRLIIKENKSIPLITLQASFLGGVRFENEQNNGIHRLMAIMLTKGTKRQNSLEIAKKVERMAGSLSGFSGYNSFGLTFTFPSQYFDEAISLFSEILKEPAFDKEELEKRKRLIIAAIRQQEDDLDRSVFRLFQKVLYEKHPYRMDPLGTVESIQRITEKDLIELYKKIAVTENMVITIVGDIDKKQALDAIKKGFEVIERRGFYHPVLPRELPSQKIKRVEDFKEKEQAHFVLGFLGPSLKDKERYAIEVLDAALSGQGGRLFYELRDKKSLAYALSFVGNPNLDQGYIGVYMGTHPSKLEIAIQSTLMELKKIKEEGLTEEEIERAKRYLIGNYEIGLQTNSAWANTLSLDELYSLGFDHYQRYISEIQKVTKDDIQKIVNKYFNLEGYSLAIIRPKEIKKNE